jgi:tetratricopeptide (TPR) repeat protein
MRRERVSLPEDSAMSADPIATACRLHERAMLHHRRQRLDRAEALGRRSLRLLRRAAGRDHPDVAHVLTALAGILHDQGRYAEAERCARRAVRILRAAPDEPVVQRLRVQALSRLANVLRAQGRAVEAEVLYRRALAIYEATLGPRHPKVVACREDCAALAR